MSLSPFLPSSQSDKNPMHFGAIVCCMGVRYKNYCSNICRTFMVNPPEKMQKEYELLLELFDVLINKLKVSGWISDSAVCDPGNVWCHFNKAFRVH